MKKLILLLCIFALFSSVNAQNVGINATGATAHSSAILDVSSSSSGILIPRLALTQTTSAAPVTSPEISLMVYNTATVNDVTPGFYYWNGSSWVRFLAGAVYAWNLTGNAGTTPGTNFLGTTDAQDFTIRTNNVENVRVTSGGLVGVGITAPTHKMTIQSATVSALRLIGPGSFGSTARLNLGDGNYVYIEEDADDYLTIYGSNRTAIMGGNVGIGTTTPSAKLHVSSDVRSDGIVYWGNGLSRTETRDNAGLRGDAGARSGFFETTTPVNYPGGASGWWHLIDTRHSNNGNNYAMQLAGSFFDQSLYFRKTNDNAAQPWTKVLTTADYSANITYDYSNASMTAPNGSMSVIPGMTRTLTLQAGDILYLHAHGGVMATGSNYASVEFGIRVNGADLPNGGYTKTSVDYSGTNYLAFANWAVSGHYPVTASGTYTIAVYCGRFGGNGDATVGGNNTTVTQGSIRIEVIRPSY
jgi:environmental stress-induced protein Ves